MTKAAYRIERDTMGEVRVPTSALYGAQTARAVENFPISGQPIPAPVIRALGILKGAAATVNERDGLLPPPMAEAIRQAAAEVAGGRLDQHFPVDVFQTGSGTSSNMNANEVIAARASQIMGKTRGKKPVHANDHVNLGQSSNDVFPSAVQIALLLMGQEKLWPALSLLANTFHELADANWEKVVTGRTHLMDAMPIRVGQVFRGYAHHCELGLSRIKQAFEGLRELPLGGTAVGTGVNARPGFAAAVCALVTSQHAVVHASAAMRTFATALYKIANDLRWLGSSAIGELRLPELQPGSSIMPAKVNPVACEAVLMVCAQVMGDDAVVAFGNSQGQFQLNTMMPVMARNALESATLLAQACTVLVERCLRGISVTRTASARVAQNPILATALTGTIGYEKAAEIAKAAAEQGRTVAEVAAERSGLDPKKLAELLDPLRLCGEDGRQR
jgi:fumarate hydratase class II